MKEHVNRMVGEESELRARVKALNEFIRVNPIFDTLEKDEQRRMITQLAGMEMYLKALSERLMVQSGGF